MTSPSPHSLPPKTAGLHHVTAIASDPVANVRFWSDDLGLRLVKQTVNFDDPSVHHLYFGDHAGSPGTLLTFFPWPGARRGRRGTGQATSVGFAVPEGSLSFWQRRLAGRGLAVEEIRERFGERVLGVLDPDGLHAELIETATPDDLDEPERSGIPRDAAIRGFHGVTLSVRATDPTATTLELLGFRLERTEGARARFSTGESTLATALDVLEEPDRGRGAIAAGSVHHVAFRATDDEEQGRFQRAVAADGLSVTPVQDRQYFHSIYFREPGGVLFEIATDPPGFTIDEDVADLGTGLRLPPWLEGRRTEIEEALPPLRETGTTP